MTCNQSQPNIVEQLRGIQTTCPSLHGTFSAAADRIEELEADLSDTEAQLDAFGKVSPQQYQKEAAVLRAKVDELEGDLETMAEGYAAASRAIGRRGTEEESLADQITSLIAKVDELTAALKFSLEVMEGYAFSSGTDPRTATPSSAIGRARAALSTPGQAGAFRPGRDPVGNPKIGS